MLPARVADYSPAMLDELLGAGEVVWTGAGTLPGSDGWVQLHPADLVLPVLRDVPEPDAVGQAILDALDGGGAFLFRQLTDGRRRVRRLRSWPRRSGSWSGRAGSPATRSPRCARCSAVVARTARRPARPVPGFGPDAAAPRRRGSPSRDRRRSPGAGSGSTTPRPTPRSSSWPAPRRCSRGTASSPAARSSPSRHPAGSPPPIACSASSSRPARACAATTSTPWARPSSPHRPRSTGCARTSATTTSRPRRGARARGHRSRQPVRRGAALARRRRPRRVVAPSAGPQGRLARGHPRRPRRAATSSAAAARRSCSTTTRAGSPPAATALAALVRTGRVPRLTVETAGGRSVGSTALGEALREAGFVPHPKGLRLDARR